MLESLLAEHKCAEDRYASKFHAVLCITRQARSGKLVFDEQGKLGVYNGKSLLEECEKFWVARESYGFADIAHKAVNQYIEMYGSDTPGETKFADGFGTTTEEVEMYDRK